jgi:hypothetical protein
MKLERRILEPLTRLQRESCHHDVIVSSAES